MSSLWRVLYVEDDRASQKLIQLILTRWPGCSCILADDAGAGWAEVLRQPPDLLLLDICLPDCDGFSFFSELRADTGLPCFPIVAVSAHALPQDIARAFALGFDDYIVKPFDLAEFKRVVARFLPG